MASTLLRPAPAAAQAPSQHDPLPIRPARTVTFETREGTSMDVDVAPDGATLVFSLLGDLYTLPSTGGRARAITRGTAWDREPAWSPDGRRIAYVTDRGGREEVWVVDADGANPHRVVTDPSSPMLLNPVWTPDGQYLAVEHHRESRVGTFLHHLRGGRLPLASAAPLIGEVRFTPDGRYFYYSPDNGRVERYDRASGERQAVMTLPLPAAGGHPPGVLRPIISADGRWLTYVAVLDWLWPHFGLRVRDLRTGEERRLADSIGRWRDGRAYERYALTPDSRAAIIGFGGKLHRIELATGRRELIPFTAAVRAELGWPVHQRYRVTDEPLAVRYVRSAQGSPDGTRLVFSALARVYTMALPHGVPRPLAPQPDHQFQPVVSPDGRWVAYVTWSDVEGGHLWRVPAAGGTPERLTTEAGLYERPEWSPDGSALAVVKASAATERLNHWAAPVGELQLIPSSGGPARVLADSVPVDNQLTFLDGGARLAYLAASDRFQEADKRLCSVRLDGTDRRTLVVIAGSYRTEQVTPSPDGRYLAYVLRDDLYLTPLPRTAEPILLGDSAAAVPVVRLTRQGGLDPRWERGGQTLSWGYANTFARIDPDRAIAAEGAVAPDEVVTIRLTVPRHSPRGTIALRGARVITMRGDQVIEEATVVVKDGRITAVGPAAAVAIPKHATVLELRGKTIMPGVVDLHAHVGPPRDILVQQSWEYLSRLAFGNTTTRDVSQTRDGFGYYELVETGQMIGPRSFTAGASISSGQPTNNVRITSLDDARDIIRRYRRLGAVVVKDYEQPTRRQHQWLLMAAQEAGLNVAAHLDANLLLGRFGLTPALDGFSSWEHAFWQTDVYSDAVRLMAASKIWLTPTLVVHGLGPWIARYRSEARYRVHDPKARRFLADRTLRRLMADPDVDTTRAPLVTDMAKVVARIRLAGGHVALGSHGDVSGLQSHWELWALQQGGLSPLEALRVATLSGAQGLGMDRDLGSLEVGKLADLLVLAQNPLEQIEHSLSIRYVMKQGELYEGDTLETLWPVRRPAPVWRYGGNAAASASASTR